MDFGLFTDGICVDEPSVFLDVDRPAAIVDQLSRFSERTDRPVLVVDHNLFVIDRVADRLVVFDEAPVEQGRTDPPQSLRAGMNAFLSSFGITFRRNERTGPPRVNKPGSQLDRERKRTAGLS